MGRCGATASNEDTDRTSNKGHPARFWADPSASCRPRARRRNPETAAGSGQAFEPLGHSFEIAGEHLTLTVARI